MVVSIMNKVLSFCVLSLWIVQVSSQARTDTCGVADFYSQDWVYFNANDASYNYLNGYYIKNDSKVYGDDENTATPPCDTDYKCDILKYYPGTYMYYKYPDGGTTYYMFEIPGAVSWPQVSISGSICSAASIVKSPELTAIVFQDPISWCATWKSETGSAAWTTDSPTTLAVTFCDDIGGPSCNTLSPSSAPTPQPIPIPTPIPTQPSTIPTNAPTGAPTPPTATPTNAPSTSPTARPTRLPTITKKEYYAVNCDGLTVKHLDEVFPSSQSNTEFNLVSFTHTEHSVWSNGDILIYFSTRYDDNGEWVISNGSYHMLNDETVPTINSTIPGDGFELYDHFPNDNIYATIDYSITLFFQCFTTSFPTIAPTPSPTHGTPTMSPTSTPVAPTAAPTPACGGMETLSKDIDCADISVTLGTLFDVAWSQQASLYNNRVWWRGINNAKKDFTFYYSTNYDSWIINSGTTYAAIGNNDDTEDDSNNFPPTNSVYDVIAISDPFSQTCSVNITYTCSATSGPTKPPTPPSGSPAPTAPQPTVFPTPSPTPAPTGIPTNAPTDIPTNAPTSAPTNLCLGLNVMGALNLSGPFNQGDGTINSHDWWFAINEDTKLFYSIAASHDTWVLYSADLSQYFLSVNTPPEQPASGEWELYLGAAPFVQDTYTLTLECLDTKQATPVPTFSPTFSPTGFPTIYREPCQFAYVTSNSTVASAYLGEFSLDDVVDGDKNDSWTSTSDSDYTIYSLDGYWYLDNGDSVLATTLAIEYDYWKPPDEGVWQFQDIKYYTPSPISINVGENETSTTQMPQTTTSAVIGDTVYIEFDCSETGIPTDAPSDVPTTSPTPAPTFGCEALNLETDVEFEYSAKYFRQDYLLHGHYWWRSDYVGAIIAYDSSGGYWHVTKVSDGGEILIELLEQNGDNEIFPPDGNYYYAYTDTEIAVTFDCDVALTTELPSDYPSLAPTVNVGPSIECNSKPFFEFVETDAETWTVNWDEPDGSDSSGNYTITSDSIYSPGDALPKGLNTITYTITDNFGLTDSCPIDIYVVGESSYSTYDYCLIDNFVITINIDEDNEYSIVDDITTVSYTGSDNTVGTVSHSDLNNDNQNCYVSATILQGTQAAAVADDPISQVAQFDYWWLIILIFGLWLLGMTIWLIVLCCKRNKDKSEDQQGLLMNQQNPSDMQEMMAQSAGIASSDAMRRATVTSSPQIQSQPSQAKLSVNSSFNNNNSRDNSRDNLSNHLNLNNGGDIELGVVTPGGANGPASLVLQDDESEAPISTVFWRDQLDYLFDKGNDDGKRNLQRLSDMAVRVNGQIDKNLTAINVMNSYRNDRGLPPIPVEQALEEMNKDKPHYEPIEPKLDAPAFAPPTMSSMSFDKSDDHVLAGMTAQGPNGGSYVIPDSNLQGQPPNPVPPPKDANWKPPPPVNNPPPQAYARLSGAEPGLPDEDDEEPQAPDPKKLANQRQSTGLDL